MSKCLVVITGIGKVAYGIKDIKKSPLREKIEAEYSEILEIKYQPILDKHAFFGKTLLDPFRFMFTPQGWKAEKYIRKRLHQIRNTHKVVHVMTHSLASWIIYKMDVHFEKAIIIASPVGWCTPLSRWAVKTNIGRPKMTADHMNFVYSSKDPVSRLGGNRKYYAESTKIYDTETSHKLSEYLEYLHKIQGFV